MGKIKKRNKEKRKNLNGITLKEMVEKGIVDKHYHLKEKRFVGGLTMPEKMNSWWKKESK